MRSSSNPPKRKLLLQLQLQLIVLCLFAAPSLANTRFDPDTGTSDMCSIPPYQQEGDAYVPPDAESLCPAVDLVQPLTDSLRQLLAEQYAPVLFFHPLESYTLETVDATFVIPSAGKVYFDAQGSREVANESLNQTYMLDTVVDRTKALNKNLYSFGRDQTKQYQSGAGFENNNNNNNTLSRAPVYYNVFDYSESAVVINYHFYYTWHDSATFGVVGSYENSTYYENFRTVPFGAHEGDWQGMSVIVCKSAAFNLVNTLNPLSVAYKQYQSRQVTDCTKGECTLYRDSIRPVGFVARGTHATYPVTATNMVYSELNVEFFINLQGVLTVDKTNYKADDGSYRMFMANSTNVIKHEDPVDVDFGTVPETDYWQGFGGEWGCTCLIEIEALKLDSENPGPSECFNTSGTAIVDCPDLDDATFGSFKLVNQLLGVVGLDGDTLLENARLLAGNVRSYFSDESPYGPATYPEFQQWIPPVNSQVRSQVGDNLTALEYCQRLVSVYDTSRQPAEYETIPLYRNIYGLLAFCCVIMVLNIIVFTHPYFHRFRKPRPVILFDEDGIAQPPDRETAIMLFGPAVGYTFFYLFTMIGIALYFQGYTKLVDLLDDTLGINLGAVETLSYLFGLAVVFIDTALAVFIWFPTRGVWRMVNIAYYDLIGDDEMMQLHQNKRFSCGGKTALVTFHFMYGVLFNSLIIGVLTVLIGAVNVGMAFAFGEVCVNIFGSLDNICLDLDSWGILIECGPDFSSFCSKWASSESIVTLWGSFIVVAGHYYLIGEAGAASKTFRSIPNALFLLPSRKVYLDRVANIGHIQDDFVQRAPELENGEDDGNAESENENENENEHDTEANEDKSDEEIPRAAQQITGPEPKESKAKGVDVIVD